MPTAGSVSSGHPSHWYPRSTLLNCGDRTEGWHRRRPKTSKVLGCRQCSGGETVQYSSNRSSLVTAAIVKHRRIERFGGETWGKGLFRGNNYGWMNNIEKDIKEIEWEVLDGIDVFQNTDIWRLFWTRECTFGFYKIRGNSWLAGKLLAPQKWIWFTDLVAAVRQFYLLSYSTRTASAGSGKHLALCFKWLRSQRIWSARPVLPTGTYFSLRFTLFIDTCSTIGYNGRRTSHNFYV